MKINLGQSCVAALLVTGALALASCTETTSVTSTPSGGFGPGQPGTGGSPGTGTAGANGQRIQLLITNPQLPSAGTSQVDMAAVVLDAAGQAVAGVPVTFSTAPDPTAFVDPPTNGGQTGTNGTVSTKLNLGANKSNRTITVTASTAAGATITNTVGVIGTTITISGNSSLAFQATTTLTFALKDSAGVPIPGFPLTISSQTGNSIAPAQANTDGSGEVTSVVTASQPANDVITATAAGATKQLGLTISGASFTFTTPAPNIDIPLGAATPLTVHWTDAGGVPQSGQQVTFSASRGTISGSPSTVNGTGDTPGVSITSATSAGPAIITASGPGGTPAATLNVNFVATTATSVSLQAVPNIVQVSSGAPGQTNNISTITATVRDANNNLVKNALVNFSIVDQSGGSLAANTAITDLTGTAVVNYRAGSNSATNPAQITATVTQVNGAPIAPLTATTTVTVAGQVFFVRLGTDNLVQTLPPPSPNLQKIWAAIVTDAAGNAVANTQVRFKVTSSGSAPTPNRYGKGFYVFDTVANHWVISPPGPTLCASEDTNNNGIIDPGEDFNGNGRLDPGNVVSVNLTATTDASGTALATLTYSKSFATWVEVKLEASAGVVGNDPPAVAVFFLDGLASDYTNKDVAPPGAISPFGVATVCSDPN